MHMPSVATKRNCWEVHRVHLRAILVVKVPGWWCGVCVYKKMIYLSPPPPFPPDQMGGGELGHSVVGGGGEGFTRDGLPNVIFCILFTTG